MIRIREIDHVVIRTANLNGLLRFYCNVLGCAVERRRDDIELIQLRAGRSMIDLVTVDGKLGRKGGAAPGPEGRNMDHVSLRIEPFNIEDIRSHLNAFGVEYSGVQTNYGLRAMDYQSTSETPMAMRSS